MGMGCRGGALVEIALPLNTRFRSRQVNEVAAEEIEGGVKLYKPRRWNGDLRLHARWHGVGNSNQRTVFSGQQRTGALPLPFRRGRATSQQQLATTVELEVEVGICLSHGIGGQEEFDAAIGTDRIAKFLRDSSYILVFNAEDRGEKVIIVGDANLCVRMMTGVVKSIIRDLQWLYIAPQGTAPVCAGVAEWPFGAAYRVFHDSLRRSAGVGRNRADENSGSVC